MSAGLCVLAHNKKLTLKKGKSLAFAKEKKTLVANNQVFCKLVLLSEDQFYFFCGKGGDLAQKKCGEKPTV